MSFIQIIFDYIIPFLVAVIPPASITYVVNRVIQHRLYIHVSRQQIKGDEEICYRFAIQNTEDVDYKGPIKIRIYPATANATLYKVDMIYGPDITGTKFPEPNNTDSDRVFLLPYLRALSTCVFVCLANNVTNRLIIELYKGKNVKPFLVRESDDLIEEGYLYKLLPDLKILFVSLTASIICFLAPFHMSFLLGYTKLFFSNNVINSVVWDGTKKVTGLDSIDYLILIIMSGLIILSFSAFRRPPPPLIQGYLGSTIDTRIKNKPATLTAANESSTENAEGINVTSKPLPGLLPEHKENNGKK